MTRPRLLLLAILPVCALALAGCGSGDGASAAPKATVRITDATIDWPANPEVAAVRLRVRNDGSHDDELQGVSTQVARSAMVHRSSVDASGRSTMAPVAGLTIPARSTVTFEPGGLHIMLDGLTRDLRIGDRVPVTMVFRDAGSITTEAKVVAPGSVDLGSGEEAGHDH